MESPKATISTSATTTRIQAAKKAVEELAPMKEWKYTLKFDNAHVDRGCGYNACRGRAKPAGHSSDCPSEESDDDEAEINQISDKQPPNQQRMEVDLPQSPQKMATSVNSHNDEISIVCNQDHPMHGRVHWTACYVDNCRIHTKAYYPQPPRRMPNCRYCGNYGHYQDTCLKFHQLRLRREKAGKAAAMKINISKARVCTYCSTKGHLVS